MWHYCICMSCHMKEWIKMCILADTGLIFIFVMTGFVVCSMNFSTLWVRPWALNWQLSCRTVHFCLVVHVCGWLNLFLPLLYVSSILLHIHPLLMSHRRSSYWTSSLTAANWIIFVTLTSMESIRDSFQKVGRSSRGVMYHELCWLKMPVIWNERTVCKLTDM